MISLDTNVLVRILVDDGSAEQTQAARKLAKKARQVYITQIVQVELVWVLTKAFKLSKPQILKVLNELYLNAAYHLEKEADFVNALACFEAAKSDFADCLILAASQAAQHVPVYSFDRKFANLKPVELLR